MTFNVYVPSENVFVDRKVQWSSGVYQTFNVYKTSPTTGAAVPWTAGDVLCRPGVQISLCAFPLNSLVATLSATINDTTCVINSQDVLKEVLRLTDYKKNRLVRTTPTMLDKYAQYSDAASAVNAPGAGYASATDYDNVPNGAFPQLQFSGPTGSLRPADLVGTSYTAPSGTTVQYNANAQPEVLVPAASDSSALPVYVYWSTAEPIVLSPFVFNDHCEWDTGLFGLNNIQLIANFLSQSQIRNIRCNPNVVDVAGGGSCRYIAPGSLNFNTSVPNVFSNPKLNVQFLTPSLDVPLPPKSVVPYMEFPRYISQTTSGVLAPLASTQIQSQTITLPQIPDLLIVYVKPNSGQYTTWGSGLPGQTGAQPSLTDYSQADWYFSVGNWAAQNSASFINQTPITINFDNFSGLLSSVVVQQLYNMSVKNGLDMDWATWTGVAYPGPTSGLSQSWKSYSTGATPTVTAVDGGSGLLAPLVGSILVLKPSQDITLQPGQAPSLVGNFTLQFNLTITNQSRFTAQPSLYVITANSGFFESIRGSSRIIKGVLSEQDVISATAGGAMMSRSDLDRLVGGSSFNGLSNVVHKAADLYSKTKPEGAGMGAGHMGAGEGAGMGAGASSMGAGMGAGRRKLAARLM